MIVLLYTITLYLNEFLISLDSRQIDKNKKALVDLWAMCASDKNKAQEAEGQKITSKLVTHNVKDQVSNVTF